MPPRRKIPAASDQEAQVLHLLQGLSTVYSQNALAARLGVVRKTVGRWLRGECHPPLYIEAKLRELAEPAQVAPTCEQWFRYIDLFAGIGGFRMAFDGLGGECVFTSEWDENCQRAYKANYAGNHPLVGDIREVKAADVPDHDLLLAGFPCQPFSLAGVVKKESLGRKHGFLDKTQGTLFFDVARIIEAKRPRAFILENVKHLLGHDGGKTFKTIMTTLSALGYIVESRVVDSSAWVPQRRERIFIVGFDSMTDFTWEDLVVPMSPKPRLRDILHPADGSETEESPYTTGAKAEVAAKYTLTENLWAYLKKYAAKHRDAGNGFGYGLFGGDDVARTLSARYYKDGSEVLIRRNSGRPRRLTPRECARLMGFDRPGRTPYKIVVSDMQAYRQFGNAVVVPAVEAVGQLVLPRLRQLMQGGPVQARLPLGQTG